MAMMAATLPESWFKLRTGPSTGQLTKAEVVVIARTSLAAARSSRLTEVEPQRFTNHLRKPFPGEFTNFMYHFAIRFPQSYGRRLVPIVGQVPNITIIYGHF